VHREAPAGLVSIVLPTLNGADHIEWALRSCQHQTYAPIEIIVVDGGSTDGTLEAIAQLSGASTRLVHQDDNAGALPGAINLGVAASRGEFITWTQDDSAFAPCAIDVMVRYLRANREVDTVYTDYWRVDEKRRRIRYMRARQPAAGEHTDVIDQSFVIRRSVWEALGPQDTTYFPVHEVPWRLRLVRAFRASPLHVPLVEYMVHDRSLTGRIGAWEIERMTARALRAADRRSWLWYRRRQARIDVDEAFSRFVFDADQGGFRSLWLRAVMRDPSHLTNRGLWRLALTPGRRATSLRRRLHSEWLQEDEAQQRLWAGEGERTLAAWS
jgi:glycosyltransferase involved in cell wall biosynthesis